MPKLKDHIFSAIHLQPHMDLSTSWDQQVSPQPLLAGKVGTGDSSAWAPTQQGGDGLLLFHDVHQSLM